MSVARVRGLPDRILDGLISRFEGVVGRVLRRIARALARALDATGTPLPDAQVHDLIQVHWQRSVDAEVLPALARVHRSAATVMAEQLAGYGYQLPGILSADDYLRQARNRLVAAADTVWESVRAQLAEGVQAGDSIRELAARVQASAGFGPARAATIARTEVVAANNAASLATALAADDGTIRKQWLATPDVDGTGCDERTRAAHCAADGQTRPLVEPFDVGGAPLMFPGDPSGPPDLVINCRCAPGYLLDEPTVASLADFHRPGGRDHDQRAHGRRRASGGVPDMPDAAQATAKARRRRRPASRRLPAGANPAVDIVAAGGLNRPAQTRVRKALTAVYTWTDPGSGLRTQVDRAEVQPGSRSAVVDFTIVDAAGVRRGFGTRMWHVDDDGRLTIGHTELVLDRTVQGGGFAARFNAQTEQAYQEAGAVAVHLHADMDVGGYAWAVAGYDFRREHDLLNTAQRLARHAAASGVDEHTRAQVADLLARATAADFAAGTHPTPFEFAMTGRHAARALDLPGGRQTLTWLGKQAMLGSDWQGRKPLPAPVVAATGRGLLDEVAASALAYAEAVADAVPAVPEDAGLVEDTPSAYPAHHHLVSAPPDVEQVLLDLADELLDDRAGATDMRADEDRGLVAMDDDTLTADGGPQVHVTATLAADGQVQVGFGDGEPVTLPAAETAALVDGVLYLGGVPLPDGHDPVEVDGFVAGDEVSVSLYGDGTYGVVFDARAVEVLFGPADIARFEQRLRRLLVQDPSEPVTASLGDFHRPGGRDHDQSTHGRRRSLKPKPSAGPATPAPAASNDRESLARNTVPQLRALARERGVRVPARARKADIVDLLAADTQTRPGPEQTGLQPPGGLVPAEPPRPTRAGTEPDPQLVADRVATLRAATRRVDAEAAVADLDGKTLRAVAAEIGARTFRSPRLADIREAIVEMVQRRLDSEAIERTGRGVPFSATDPGGLVAAAQVHTGAMVALVPAPEDAARLAVDGGEPAEQLHLTLAYLGDAANFSSEARDRVVEAVADAVADLPISDADGFAVSVFNPGDASDRDTCIVLGLSGDGLEDVHGAVEEALANVQDAGNFMLPDQHAPWIPHLTLAYTDDLSMVEQLTDRVGPVTFDRLRVAFGGDDIDIPLGVPPMLDELAVGDRVQVVGQQHGEGQAEGTVVEVDPGPAYGIRFDGSASVHRWYVGRELAPADGADEHPDDAQVPDGEVAVVQAAVLQSGMPPQLQRYWIRKLRMGTKGSFRRCVRAIRAHYPQDPEGTCANLYHEATGRWPGRKKNHSISGGDAMAVETVESDQAGDECPPGHHRMPDGNCMPGDDMPDEMPPMAVGQPDEMPPMAVGQPGEHFHTRVMEGVSTGMRQFAPGALSWRDTPFAYHWQFKSSAHNGVPETVQVGLVTRAERDGDLVHFWGRLDLRSAEGLDYARRLAEGFARWSSVGPDESLKDTNIDVEYLLADDADGPVVEPQVDEMTFRAYRVAEVTAVSVPALADATVEPTQELIDTLTEMGVISAPAGAEPEEVEQVTFPPDVTAAQVLEDLTGFGAVGSHDSGTSDEPWDADANVGRLPSPMTIAAAQDVFAWVDDSRAEDGTLPKDAGRFPHHEVSADGSPGAANLTACSAGIAALHGARGGTTIPDTDRRGVYNHLRAHLMAGGREPDTIPDFDGVPQPIVAAGYTVTIPDLPPAAWFDEPADLSPHGELRVNEQGRLWGYLAPRGVAHRSFSRRVEVPMGRVDYGGWMNKPWPVAEGHKVYVGVITMDCGHASTNPDDWSYEHRREHYDNSCSVAAHARIGENDHGVWVAGALAPWIDAERLGRMMSCQLSGDWARHGDRPGWRDFVAALLVPAPGFPNRVPPASVRVAEGALVASAVPVRFVHNVQEQADASLRPVLERIARGIGRDTRTRMAALHARVHRGR